MKPKFEDVEREIRRLAHEHPDHTTAFYYASAGGPCCIVGTALYGLGVTAAELLAYDEDEDGVSASSTVEGGSLSDAKWINEVQTQQDYGHPWSVALGLADSKFRNE